MKERNKVLEGILNFADIAGKIILVVIMAFPFFWMISTSLKTLHETILVPPSMLPAVPQWENYPKVFSTINVWLYLRNSIVVCVSVVLLQYLIIVPCAYGLSRYEFKAKPLIFALVMLGQMIPMQITFLPIYFMFSKMKLMDNYISLVVPFISNPFGIFLLRQYFLQVPQEVIEAAKMDNASDLKIMWKIMMPMSKSALVTLGLLAFISNWNNYFWPLIMTSKETFRTLPIGIALLRDADAIQSWNIIMAGNMLLVMPMLLLYVLASRKIRNAFVYSRIK